jgi:4-hydroxybenzoate polyprenyltransferase
MGYFFFIEASNGYFDFFQLLAGLTGMFLILCYVMAINDCFDVEDDRIKSKFTNKKIVVSGEISVRAAISLSLVMLFSGLTISWFVSENFLAIVLLIVILSTLYSVPPVRYKRIFPIGTLGESVGAFLPFLAGYSVLSSPDLRALVVSSFFAVVTIYLRFFHESVFHEIDRKTGKKTFAVVFGPGTALNIGRFFLLFGIGQFLILLAFSWFSPKFFLVSILYMLLSLGLLIKFVQRHIPEPLVSYANEWSANHFPKFAKKLLEDSVVSIWGCALLIAAVVLTLS